MPDLPITRKQALASAAALLALLFVAGRTLVQTGTAARTAPVAPRRTTARAAPLVVHVVGAVRRPGLYDFPQGARVADAVTHAGGATRRADLTLINLAAPLADGQQIVVPRRGTATAGAAATGAAPAGPVHLNTATLEQLDALPGVGPVTAQKILDYRQKHGAFSSVDDLDAVSGIGPARLDTLRDLVAP
jgi:competence protein ComEA